MDGPATGRPEGISMKKWNDSSTFCNGTIYNFDDRGKGIRLTVRTGPWHGQDKWYFVAVAYDFKAPGSGPQINTGNDMCDDFYFATKEDAMASAEKWLEDQLASGFVAVSPGDFMKTYIRKVR